MAQLGLLGCSRRAGRGNQCRRARAHGGVGGGIVPGKRSSGGRGRGAGREGGPVPDPHNALFLAHGFGGRKTKRLFINSIVECELCNRTIPFRVRTE